MAASPARKKLENLFSWSKSRHERLSFCPRAYYWSYYGSWGGWERGAAPEVREAHLLKKLGNRWTWAGSAVHATVREHLLAQQRGRAVDTAALLARTRERMRADFKASRAGDYRRGSIRKEFSGLVEHEYREPVSDADWAALWSTVEQALRWFFDSAWSQIGTTLGPGDWLEVDTLDFDASSFQHQGVRVFAVPDFAYREANGWVHVVDWKTGTPREGYDVQALGYVRYLAARHGTDPAKTRATLVYLNAGQNVPLDVSAARLEEFDAQFASSVADMRALLSDVAQNVPRPREAFVQLDDESPCRACAFRRLCGREAPEKQVEERSAERSVPASEAGGLQGARW